MCLKQHMYYVKKTIASDGFVEHVAASNHDIEWDKASTIAKARSWISRHYLESPAIQTAEENAESRWQFSA